MEIKQKIKNILEGLSRGIYEKDEVIFLALLTAVAGESIFLLGPPGVAKSLIARRLKYAFKDGKSFEYLMNKFSTPDEIFGPVSIKKLKEEDKYERLTEKYLPGANIVFLDEIWKAGPSIQNALLTIINEKIYRNGEQEIKVDIKNIISASNELPARGEGLEALWDRFLVRYMIHEIQERGNFLSMITNTEDPYSDHIPEEAKISNDELHLWSRAIDEVAIPNEVLNTVQVLKHKIDAHDQNAEIPFLIYDRRWKKTIRLLRTSAFLNGRKEVDLMDCFLMIHCLWSHPSHIGLLQQMVAETIRKHGYTIALNLNGLRKEIEAFEEDVKTETRVPYQVTRNELYLIDKKYLEVINVQNIVDGKFIRSAEFERLGIDEFVPIGLYDENHKLTYKIKSRKGKQENTLEIQHNSQVKSFALKTLQSEKQEFIEKKPHELVLKFWEDKVSSLLKYIQENKKRITTEAPSELGKLKSNLFVNPSLANIVEANMNEAVNAVHELELRIEKVQHFYRNL